MFPLVRQEDGLVARDFVLFSLPFGRTVTYFLPGDSVHFFPIYGLLGEEESGLDSLSDDTPEVWQPGIALMVKKKQPVVNNEGNVLFLPIWRDNQIVAAAVLTGGGMARYEEYSLEWLHERSRLISRELRKIKQWAFDPESGLLNGQSLQEDLSILLNILQESLSVPGHEKNGCWFLLVLAISPKGRNAGQTSADIARAGISLKSFFGEMVAIHHFGSGLFGMLWRGEDNSDFRKLGYALLAKMKRHNFAKVHIGIAPLVEHDGSTKDGGGLESADFFLAAAWRSLKEAEGRGPFALCSGMAGRAAQLFRSPESPVKMALGKLWRGVASFSIVLILVDNSPGSEEFSKKVCALVGEEGTLLLENDKEAYLYLPALGTNETLVWLERFKSKISQFAKGTFSMGVASFPCHGFSRKLDVPVNARKALSHAAFFGPDTVTVFDGISLNISGDVYYNEGDLTGAIKEYRLGLRLDPDNINLLNSLAVIYAQINRYGIAIPLFDQVLKLDPQNFMALFNLGFAYLRRKDLQGAVLFFERALGVDNEYYDLLLQLGRIYCRLERFDDALQLLKKAEGIGPVQVASAKFKSWRRKELPERANADISDGLIFKYLAHAYQGTGNNRDAMAALQKAISYDPRDAEALSRLGELCLIEREGDDIALSFCQQAIDIDEEVGGHWYRLAAVQERMGKMSEALFSLRHCLATESKNIKALLLLAKVHDDMGRKSPANRTYERVLRIDKSNKTAQKAMKRR